MTTTTAPTILDEHALIEALRRVCGGAVHEPGDPGCDDARQPWASEVDQRPRTVTYPADADEVAAVVRLAAAARVHGRPAGHRSQRRPHRSDARRDPAPHRRSRACLESPADR